jgi:hypothetical protein
MLSCGQNSAVGRYRAVIGGFDRPLPMLGAVYPCLRRLKARSCLQATTGLHASASSPNRETHLGNARLTWLREDKPCFVGCCSQSRL